MEDAVVQSINFQNIETRNKLIEYLKLFTVKDGEEFVERRKLLRRKNDDFERSRSFINGLLMSILPVEDILKKLESEPQSQST